MGLLSRSFSLAKLTVGAGTQLAAHKVKTLMHGPQKSHEAKAEDWKNFLIEQSRRFSGEIGELKGSLMKAGQMLSVVGEHFLPAEVNEELKRLQNDSPPVEWDSIYQILVRELGVERLAELEIEKESLASASLGQVHRARIKATGQSIVLKIQYPGVDQVIESDIKAIRHFLGLLQIFPVEGSLEPILDEIKEMLRQETQYDHEIQLMEKYRKSLGDDPRFVIPVVLPFFCSKKVIAMTYERGLKADDPLVQSLSQERRNRLAVSFLDLFFKEVFQWHFVQTDPHLGNYRLRLDPAGGDRIVLLDFGATKAFSAPFMAQYLQLVQSLVLEPHRVTDICYQLGFLKAEDDPRLIELFRDLTLATVEPFSGVEYDWKRTDLPDRLTQGALEIARRYPLRTPPREFLFLNRKTAGVFVFLSVLGAKISTRELILRYLKGS